MEYPYQTWERVYRKPWPGGRSEEVVKLLKLYDIDYTPGSAEANLVLQGVLIMISAVVTGISIIRSLLKECPK